MPMMLSPSIARLRDGAASPPRIAAPPRTLAMRALSSSSFRDIRPRRLSSEASVDPATDHHTHSWRIRKASSNFSCSTAQLEVTRTPARSPLPESVQRILRKPPLFGMTDPAFGRLTRATCSPLIFAKGQDRIPSFPFSFLSRWLIYDCGHAELSQSVPETQVTQNLSVTSPYERSKRGSSWPRSSG